MVNVVDIVKQANNFVLDIGVADRVGATIVGVIINPVNNSLYWFNSGDSIGLTMTKKERKRCTKIHNPEKEPAAFRKKYAKYLKGEGRHMRLRGCRLSACIGDGHISKRVPEYKRVSTSIVTFMDSDFRDLSIVMGVDGEYLEVKSTRNKIYEDFKKYGNFSKVFKSLESKKHKYENNTVLFIDVTTFIEKTKDLPNGYFKIWDFIDKLSLDDYFYQIHYNVFEFTEVIIEPPRVKKAQSMSALNLSSSSTSWFDALE